jgi:ribonucleoside-diphosphate reductase alpha chain
VSVEAWDAWFRWRRGTELRDLTLDSTFHRVAETLAAIEGEARPLWARRFEDALAGFRLLPDTRILRTAGSDEIGWDNHELAAVLNAAAFLRAPMTGLASFNRDAFVETAELAVRMLDDAAMIANGAPGADLRIGMIGLADALALLGLSYASEPGRAMAQSIASALAEGCLRGSVRLACERRPSDTGVEKALARAGRRGCPEALMDAARRHGSRYADLTAITAQPRLALFANNVADALDPCPGEDRIEMIEAASGVRYVQSPGYARALRRRLGPVAAGTSDTIAPCSEADQRALRLAIQPWIDAEIDYPLRAEP